MDDNLFTPFLRGMAAAWGIIFGPVVAIGIGAFLGGVVATGSVFEWTAPLNLLFSICGYGVLLLCWSVFPAIGRSLCLAAIIWILLLGVMIRWYFAPRRFGAFCGIILLTMVQVALGITEESTWGVWVRLVVAGLVIAGVYVGVRAYPIWIDRRDQEASRREKALRQAESAGHKGVDGRGEGG